MTGRQIQGDVAGGVVKTAAAQRALDPVPGFPNRAFSKAN